MSAKKLQTQSYMVPTATQSSFAGTSLQENIHARHNGTLTVRSNHYRLSSFGDYNLHDSERSLADAHSPPVFTVDDEFSILPAVSEQLFHRKYSQDKNAIVGPYGMQRNYLNDRLMPVAYPTFLFCQPINLSGYPFTRRLSDE